MNTWLPTSGIHATDELMDIIYHDGSLAVLAGAGSGKTEFLAQKSNFILSTNKCMWPLRILCLTFKNEASDNIRERVIARVPDCSGRFDSYTFHSFSKNIVDRFKSILPEKRRPSDDYDLVLKANQANGKNKVFMGNIIKLAIEILESQKNICDLFSLSYSHVFIDEFQDTTDDQYKLLSILFLGTKSKLVGVGDINQSIMLWANADINRFTQFKTDFNANQKLLLNNFRASDEIKSVLQAFLSFVENKENTVSIEKNDNCNISIFNNEHSEASAIKEHISNLLERGMSLNEICILTKQLSKEYTKSLSDLLNTSNINNVDMSDIQEYLSEPVGIIFSLFIRNIILKNPKDTHELINYYLLINGTDDNSPIADELTYEISQFIVENRNSHDKLDLDSLIDITKKSFSLFTHEKIRKTWSQYKSREYLEKVWSSLEVHYRNVYSLTGNLKDATLMFNGDNAVKIMNIHKCKGLEFKAIILIGLEDQAFWNYKGNEFENNCAIYVALSRARENIHITLSRYREHRLKNAWDNRNSSFIKLGPVIKHLVHECKFNTYDESKK